LLPGVLDSKLASMLESGLDRALQSQDQALKARQPNPCKIHAGSIQIAVLDSKLASKLGTCSVEFRQKPSD